ncbi:hypothetical protein WJX73_001908 [Symbiochloris irregularis]|uniref:Magnesium transporter n=1 Tax=Symbiochloris irregularis TaxID=706552 RepID=A0AAW1NWI8_9CHLO
MGSQGGDSGYNSGSERDRSPLIGDKNKLFHKVAEKLGGPGPPPSRRPDPPVTAVTLGAVTKKALKKCALIDAKGRLSHIMADKHTLVSETGIAHRDLRVLDPLIANTYPTAILIREKALVINLESVRMIACIDKVFLLSVPAAHYGPAGIFPTADSPFVQDLQMRLKHVGSGGTSEANMHLDPSLTFEQVALEAGLASCVRSIDQEVTDLERRAEPSLSSLSQKVSRRELENVKNVKAVLNRLIARVQKVKGVVEDILDDDQDMEDMNLAKRAQKDKEEQMLLQPDEMLGDISGPPEDPPASAFQPVDPSQPHPDLFDIEEGSYRGSSADPSNAPQHADPSSPRTPRAEGVPLDWDSKDPLANPSRRVSQQEDESAVELEGRSRSRSLERAERGRTSVSGILGGRTSMSKSPLSGATQPLLSSPDHGDGRPEGMGSLSFTGRQGLQQRASRSIMQPRLRSITKQGSMQGEYRASRRSTDDQDGVYYDGLTKTILLPRTSALVDKREIEATEDFLDSYFMQVDHTLSRLNVLKERIEGIEALVTIDLDHRRNELVAFDLVLTMVTTSFTWMAMIASIFGQNLWLSSNSLPLAALIWATIGSVAIGMGMLVAMLSYARMKRLLFIPTPQSVSMVVV